MAAFAVITACYTNIAIGVTLPARRGHPEAHQRHPAAAPSSTSAARILHALLVAVLLVVITAAFGRAFYRADIPSGTTLLRFLVMLVVGAASFCALGLAITAAGPQRRRRRRRS